MSNKDEYLPDTVKYSIWSTNPYGIQPNHKTETGTNETSVHQDGNVEQQKNREI
ncbi:hypothetical protein JOC77_001610 [Peribacillus deserti]|uniref:YpzG family protein n=1 Tax=Peribacillus deserti TaxID=673318 RepID=A0ABS2QI36_9BACI|nr:hypothetical protein [Peribacillus deserti]MBM7692183.1 hypothetical protein [Peribacillus deserti]